MGNKVDEILLRLILWREVLYIPIYTLFYDYANKFFWIVVIIDRIINLIIIAKNIDVDELFDKFLTSCKDKKFESLTKLGIFTIITTPILYILTLINNPNLFFVLIILEISDFIVIKILDNEFKISKKNK